MKAWHPLFTLFFILFSVFSVARKICAALHDGCISQSVLGTIVVVLTHAFTGMGKQYFLPPIVP